MNVIKKQGFKSSLVNYIGTIIGFIGTLFIYPLDLETYGTLKLWLSNALLLIPILTFGSNGIITKFYPIFKEKYSGGYAIYILKLTGYTLLISSSIFWLITWIFNSYLSKLNFDFLLYKNVLIQYPLAILIIFIALFKSNASNSFKIVLPNILDNWGIKLTFISILLLTYYFNITPLESIFILFTYFFIILTSMFLYNLSIAKKDFIPFKLKNISKPFQTHVNSFWLFAGLSSIGTTLAFQIDIYITASYIDNVSVGIYSTFLTIAGIISIPIRSFIEITLPLLSSKMHEEEFDKVGNIYTSLSKNLVVLGVLMFGIIWINLPEILKTMTNGEIFSPFKYTLLFLGIAKLFDLATSVNSSILNFSKWYKFSPITLIISSIINISLNIFLAPKYGIIGIALATSISMLVYNVLNTFIVYKLIKVQPFQKHMLPALLFLILIILVPDYIIFDNIIISSILKTTIFGLIYITINYYTKSSDELNNIIHNTIAKLKTR